MPHLEDTLEEAEANDCSADEAAGWQCHAQREDRLGAGSGAGHRRVCRRGTKFCLTIGDILGMFEGYFGQVWAGGGVGGGADGGSGCGAGSTTGGGGLASSPSIHMLGGAMGLGGVRLTFVFTGKVR